MVFEELEIGRGDSRARVSPARGAIVTGLSVAAPDNIHDILYMNRATFEDASKNVRGGVPVLFPFCGKLADGVFSASGAAMPQHGFGRKKPWKILSREPDRITLALDPDEDTLSAYPFAFHAEQSATALERGLRIELAIENRGAAPMPVSPGWHPYLNCPSAKKDQVTGDLPGFTPDRLTPDREFDFGLPASQDNRAMFQIPNLGRLRFAHSPNLRHMQFWSPAGADFICIEPFHGPENTINATPLMIPPGATEIFWMSLELE